MKNVRSRCAVPTRGVCGGFLQNKNALGTGIKRSKLAAEPRGERRKLRHRHVVFAARRAQGKKALLDALELAGIVLARCKRLRNLRARILERTQRRVERLHYRLDKGRRLGSTAFQAARGRRKER